MNPQSGILPAMSASALFLTLDIARDEGAIESVQKALAALPDLTTELGKIDASAGLVSAVSVGPGVWEMLMGSATPQELALFRARVDGRNKAPSTPADVFLHIRSERPDMNLELARAFLAAGEGAFELVEEVDGFRYLDNRDMTGFVDGTNNPDGDERAEVALVGDEDAAHAGGSYVLTQLFEHELDRWNQMNQQDQEKCMGRTKDTDVELKGDAKPDSSHLSRVEIEGDDGDELEILRHSMPIGDSELSGLMFIAYCAHRETFDLMLDSQYDASRSGVHDNLMDFTRARSGAFFFAPSIEALKKLG